MSKMLSSWKEIAQFFGKGVRTVQRWEKTLALPIHRPPGAPSNVVLARTSDLEAWMHHGPIEQVLASSESQANDKVAPELVEAVASLELEVSELRCLLSGETEAEAEEHLAPANANVVERVGQAVTNLKEMRSSRVGSTVPPEAFVQQLPWPAVLLDSRQRTLLTNRLLTDLMDVKLEHSMEISALFDLEVSKAASQVLRKHAPSILWQKEFAAKDTRHTYDFHLTPLTLDNGEIGLLVLLAPRENRVQASMAA